MMPSIPVKDLLLLGGGHAHVHTLKMMGMDPIDGVRVTLITRDIETPYSGMLPGYIAGVYSKEDCHVDLGKLCSFAGVRLLHTSACGIDTENKLVHCTDGRPPVKYDVLSIDIGITPSILPVAYGVNLESVTPVKPIDSFGARWEVILQRVLSATGAIHAPGMTANTASVFSGALSSTKKFHVAVVGGGAGGVELAFAFHTRLHAELIARQVLPECVCVTLYNRGSTIISQHGPAVQATVKRIMGEKGILVRYNTEVVNVVSMAGEQYLVSKDGERHHFHEAVWCTQASAQAWLKDVPGLATTEEGFIRVGPTLESISTRDIFACGDVAHLEESPRPKAGVFAVRAGPPLTANLRARLFNKPLTAWTPQAFFLGIIGTGQGYAVASKGPCCIEGKFVWQLKDNIDKAWMAEYTTKLPDKEVMMVRMQEIARNKQRLLPANEDASIPALAKEMGQATIDMLSKARMRCGGCGSKVGSQLLSRALSTVRNRLHQRPEVVTGVGGRVGDDAALVRAPTEGEYLVHTIDYFRSFIGDPYIFGKVSAVHALSDVHAMNGTCVSALALCVLPYGPEEQVEETLTHMLAGVMDVLSAEKCTLVGGHTSEGAEAALGLAVNGTVHPDRVLDKGPLPVGQTLILTKGLGTGTIMAADMRAKAKGAWVSAALRGMTQSNGPAAAILADHNCTACTDVTGFGFLGHLLEMLQYGEDLQPKAGSYAGANQLPAARIRLSTVPLLSGAAECVEQGILSSLNAENMRSARAIDNVEFGKGKVQYPLLFDPQTSGGLLGTVPNDQVTKVLEALHTAGYAQAAAVGSIVVRSDEELSSLVYLDP